MNDLKHRLTAGKNLLLETTLSGASTIAQIRRARADGYRVDMIFLTLDRLETHIQRVAARVRRGGHDIPVRDIERRFHTSYENLKKVIPDIDNLKVYDNTLPYGALNPLVKILEIQSGKVICVGKLTSKLKEIFPNIKVGQTV